MARAFTARYLRKYPSVAALLTASPPQCHHSRRATSHLPRTTTACCGRRSASQLLISKLHVSQPRESVGFNATPSPYLLIWMSASQSRALLSENLWDTANIHPKGITEKYRVSTRGHLLFVVWVTLCSASDWHVGGLSDSVFPPFQRRQGLKLPGANLGHLYRRSHSALRTGQTSKRHHTNCFWSASIRLGVASGRSSRIRPRVETTTRPQA